jgi:hypothetical protein
MLYSVHGLPVCRVLPCKGWISLFPSSRPWSSDIVSTMLYTVYSYSIFHMEGVARDDIHKSEYVHLIKSKELCCTPYMASQSAVSYHARVGLAYFQSSDIVSTMLYTVYSYSIFHMEGVARDDIHKSGMGLGLLICTPY